MKATVFSALIALALVQAVFAQSSCHYSADGVTYDLTALQNPTRDYRMVDTSTIGKYNRTYALGLSPLSHAMFCSDSLFSVATSSTSAATPSELLVTPLEAKAAFPPITFATKMVPLRRPTSPLPPSSFPPRAASELVLMPPTSTTTPSLLTVWLLRPPRCLDSTDLTAGVTVTYKNGDYCCVNGSCSRTAQSALELTFICADDSYRMPTSAAFLANERTCVTSVVLESSYACPTGMSPHPLSIARVSRQGRSPLQQPRFLWLWLLQQGCHVLLQRRLVRHRLRHDHWGQYELSRRLHS